MIDSFDCWMCGEDAVLALTDGNATTQRTTWYCSAGCLAEHVGAVEAVREEKKAARSVNR